MERLVVILFLCSLAVAAPAAKYSSAEECFKDKVAAQKAKHVEMDEHVTDYFEERCKREYGHLSPPPSITTTTTDSPNITSKPEVISFDLLWGFAIIGLISTVLTFCGLSYMICAACKRCVKCYKGKV